MCTLKIAGVHFLSTPPTAGTHQLKKVAFPPFSDPTTSTLRLEFCICCCPFMRHLTWLPTIIGDKTNNTGPFLPAPQHEHLKTLVFIGFQKVGTHIDGFAPNSFDTAGTHILSFTDKYFHIQLINSVLCISFCS
jgi:hypothetical protein